MYKTKKSQRISVSDTKTWVGYDRLGRWKLRIQKDSEVSNANNTDRVYWNEGNREVHQYSKAKLKVPQSLTKMVVVPDNKTTKQTIPNDSQPSSNDSRSKTSDSIRFPTIQYDSRPKASDSIRFQRFNTIQEPRSDVLYNPTNWWYSNSYKLMLVGVRRSTKSFPWCKLGSLVGGNSVLDPRNTSSYLYNPKYDYDNERIK